MSTLTKALLALAVALPLGAYVTGTLVASGEEPLPRPPVIIDENTVPPPDQPTGRSEPTGTASDRGDDADDNEGRGDDDDDEIDVITPRPGEVEDDDDDSGLGGGGDDDGDDRGGGDDDGGEGDGDDD